MAKLPPKRQLCKVRETSPNYAVAGTEKSTIKYRFGAELGSFIVQELCESRGGRPGLSGFRGRKDLLNRASALVTTCP